MFSAVLFGLADGAGASADRIPPHWGGAACFAIVSRGVRSIAKIGLFQFPDGRSGRSIVLEVSLCKFLYRYSLIHLRRACSTYARVLTAYPVDIGLSAVLDSLTRP